MRRVMVVDCRGGHLLRAQAGGPMTFEPPPFLALVGEIVEVQEHTLCVRPFAGRRETVKLWVNDPAPYRGHEGKALLVDGDLLMPVPIMGAP